MITELLPLSDLKMNIISKLYYEDLPLSIISKKINKSPQLIFKTIKSIPLILKNNNIYLLNKKFKIHEKQFIEQYILEKNLGKYYILLSLIKKYYNPKELILFGSYAKGDYNEKSDIDIYIISEVSLEKNLEIRIKLNEEFNKNIQIISVKSKIHLTKFDKYSKLYEEIIKFGNGIKINLDSL